RPAEGVVLILFQDIAAAVRQKRCMAARIVVMESLFTGNRVITPDNFVHSVSVGINARWPASVGSFLEQIPTVVMEVSCGVGIDVAQSRQPNASRISPTDRSRNTSSSMCHCTS